jgi:hypothetical protein
MAMPVEGLRPLPTHIPELELSPHIWAVAKILKTSQKSVQMHNTFLAKKNIQI